MDAPTRAALLETAERHGILLIEDSPYRRVSPGTPLPTLKSMDRSRSVVHLGSFAKTVFPGARVGFAVADQQVVDASGRTGLLADELAKIKSMVTVNTSSLSQAAVAGALLAGDGRISEMNVEPAAYYGNAMRTTLRSLDARLLYGPPSRPGRALERTDRRFLPHGPRPLPGGQCGADPVGTGIRRHLDADELLLSAGRRPSGPPSLHQLSDDGRYRRGHRAARAVHRGAGLGVVNSRGKARQVTGNSNAQRPRTKPRMWGWTFR